MSPPKLISGLTQTQTQNQTQTCPNLTVTLTFTLTITLTVTITLTAAWELLASKKGAQRKVTSTITYWAGVQYAQYVMVEEHGQQEAIPSGDCPLCSSSASPLRHAPFQCSG